MNACSNQWQNYRVCGEKSQMLICDTVQLAVNTRVGFATGPHLTLSPKAWPAWLFSSWAAWLLPDAGAASHHLSRDGLMNL